MDYWVPAREAGGKGEFPVEWTTLFPLLLAGMGLHGAVRELAVWIWEASFFLGAPVDALCFAVFAVECSGCCDFHRKGLVLTHPLPSRFVQLESRFLLSGCLRCGLPVFVSGSLPELCC